MGIIFEDVICEKISSVSSETIKVTFTVCRNLKEPPSLMIVLKRGTYDMTDGRDKKKECKIVIPLEFLIKCHQVMGRYHIN